MKVASDNGAELSTHSDVKNAPPVVVSADVIAQVNDLVAKGFEIPREKLVGSALLGPDLGLDSLDAVDMLVYIEENMNVKVDGERLRSIRTLHDVYVLAADSLSESKESKVKN